MKSGSRLVLILLGVALPGFAAVGASPAEALTALRPAWDTGEWWTVTSQLYDRGEKRAGAAAGWLPAETWLFSVVSTEAIEGQPCYQVAIKPGERNRCPYWFCYWFRVSDLLVLRRELHQPALRKAGPGASIPVVRTDFSVAEEMPFVPIDFPGLPVTVPHFRGELTNQYNPEAPAARRGAAPSAAPRKAARSAAGAVSQILRPNVKMQDGPDSKPGAAPAAYSPPGGARFGLFVLACSEDRYERQNWSSDLPWHAYAERWEGGQMVRKSWLSGWGRPSATPAGQPHGGEK